MRCGILGLLHESNTFLAARTTVADFAADVLVSGEQVRERFQDTPHEIGGFFEGLSQSGIEAVPIFAARAVPYGTIADEAFAELMAGMASAIDRAGHLDGLLVAPHGATVSESAPDADGHWLAGLRRRVGPTIPVIGTLDPHANLSPAMVAACNALIAYKTNPHVDQRPRGVEAAHLMARTLRGEVKPCMAAAYPPLAIDIDAQATSDPPCRELLAAAGEVRSLPGVLSASIVLGFPYADVAEMGSSAIVVTDADGEAAKRLSQRLADEMWNVRGRRTPERVSARDAIGRARSLPAPVCLLDMGDNVGGGAPGDGVWLAELLAGRSDLRSLVVLYDPEAAEGARVVGVGNRFTFRIGGRSELSGKPLQAEFTVRGCTDGRFIDFQPVHGGFTHFDQGPTAVLETDAGFTALVTSRRVPPFSIAQITSCGVDPSAFDVIVAKGVNAPIAAYGEVCRSFLRVDTPGCTAADMTTLNHRHRRRPMFPFEPEASWRLPRAGREAAV